MSAQMKQLGSELMEAVGCALALGALSTFGDWLWAHYIQDGAVIPGILHGVVIFLAIALLLAATARRAEARGLGCDPSATRRLIWALPVAGAVIAAAFYPIAMATGYLPALLVTWVAMWLVLAWLYGAARDVGAEGHRVLDLVLRGTLAAIGSGLAFWAISGIWTSPPPGGPDYPRFFASWSFAFLPGFAALLLARR